ISAFVNAGNRPACSPAHGSDIDGSGIRCACCECSYKGIRQARRAPAFTPIGALEYAAAPRARVECARVLGNDRERRSRRGRQSEVDWAPVPSAIRALEYSDAAVYCVDGPGCIERVRILRIDDQPLNGSASRPSQACPFVDLCINVRRLERVQRHRRDHAKCDECLDAIHTSPHSRTCLFVSFFTSSVLIVVLLAEEHAIALAANHGADVARWIRFLRIKEEATLDGRPFNGGACLDEISSEVIKTPPSAAPTWYECRYR